MTPKDFRSTAPKHFIFKYRHPKLNYFLDQVAHQEPTAHCSFLFITEPAPPMEHISAPCFRGPDTPRAGVAPQLEDTDSVSTEVFRVRVGVGAWRSGGTLSRRHAILFEKTLSQQDELDSHKTNKHITRIHTIISMPTLQFGAAKEAPNPIPRPRA